MTFDKFMDKVLDAFPEAYVDEDNEGQLVIYTNLKKEGEQVVKFDVDAVDEFSFDAL